MPKKSRKKVKQKPVPAPPTPTYAEKFFGVTLPRYKV